MPIDFNFFPSATFDSMTQVSPQEKAKRIGKNALRILLMGAQSNWKKLISLRVLNAVLVKRDPELLHGMRLGLQEGFGHVFEQLKQAGPLDAATQEQANLFISNCLTLLPYTDPTPHEYISMPQFINGAWTLVDYQVTPIELTPTRGFDAAFIREDDRVFAYGLSPLTDKHAEPHLVFMGTTYPAGQGFHSTVYTDLEGFETAGKKLYRSGHHKIAEWLDHQDKKTHVCGSSLGGALSLLLAIHQGEKLSRVDALNPPGLYEPWKKSKFDRWDECAEKPQVVVQKQGNDPVSAFGVWKEDWQVLHVEPSDAHKVSGLMDHALVHTGYADTAIKPIDPIADNKEHQKRNAILYTWVRGIVYYLFLVPYHYVVRPLIKFVIDNFILVLATVALLTAIALFCLPALPLLATISMLVLASIPLATRLFSKLLDAIGVWCGMKEVSPPACHEPTLSNNSPLNLYAKLFTKLQETTVALEELKQSTNLFAPVAAQGVVPPVSSAPEFQQ
jgi:hypothetical protein